MKVKRETEEKERDRELVAVLVGRDNSLTSHEKKLAEEAKSVYNDDVIMLRNDIICMLGVN